MKIAIVTAFALTGLLLFAGGINAIIGGYSSERCGDGTLRSATCERLNDVLATAVWVSLAVTFVLVFVAFVMLAIRGGLPHQ